jgi:hypothetical protein
MRATFVHELAQTRDADTHSQADSDAPQQARPPAATPETSARADTRSHRLRRITGLLPQLARARASYYDPLFERPDLIEDDYYRLRNQPYG